jgi:hypothetical protein
MTLLVVLCYTLSVSLFVVLWTPPLFIFVGGMDTFLFSLLVVLWTPSCFGIISPAVCHWNTAEHPMYHFPVVRHRNATVTVIFVWIRSLPTFLGGVSRQRFTSLLDNDLVYAERVISTRYMQISYCRKK